MTGTLTVVFTDLVGSTALRARLGERLADVVRRDHDHALADVVGRHRGRVVKATGDGILAAFDSASDAVAASAAMQQAIYSLGWSRRLELAIRVGLSAGDVSWEDGDCFGLPVVEAARLEEAAEPGQILCADIVRVLARGRADVEFRAVGVLSLKGLDEPVVAAEIAWAPSPITGGDVTPCVGRDRELDVLAGVWARGAGGCGWRGPGSGGARGR